MKVNGKDMLPLSPPVPAVALQLGEAQGPLVVPGGMPLGAAGKKRASTAWEPPPNFAALVAKARPLAAPPTGLARPDVGELDGTQVDERLGTGAFALGIRAKVDASSHFRFTMPNGASTAD